MSAEIVYLEHRPSPDLAPWVECYWTSRIHPGSSPSVTHTVLPDGCADVLVDLDRGSAHLVGTMSRPRVVTTSHPARLLAARFRPGALGSFFAVPASHLTDVMVPVEAVDPGAGEAALAEPMAEADGDTGRIALLEAWLRPRRATVGSSDPTTEAAARLLEAVHGRMDVATLAARTGMGIRQLERRFLTTVGLPPSTVARVLRFRSAVHLLEASPDRTVGRVAVACGYHDQAHLTRDFRAFSGETPAAWRRRRARGGSRDVASVQDGA